MDYESQLLCALTIDQSISGRSNALITPLNNNSGPNITTRGLTAIQWCQLCVSLGNLTFCSYLRVLVRIQCFYNGGHYTGDLLRYVLDRLFDSLTDKSYVDDSNNVDLLYIAGAIRNAMFVAFSGALAEELMAMCRLLKS